MGLFFQRYTNSRYMVSGKQNSRDSILTFCVNLINVPFYAVVIAYEKWT